MHGYHKKVMRSHHPVPPVPSKVSPGRSTPRPVGQALLPGPATGMPIPGGYARNLPHRSRPASARCRTKPAQVRVRCGPGLGASPAELIAMCRSIAFGSWSRSCRPRCAPMADAPDRRRSSGLEPSRGPAAECDEARETEAQEGERRRLGDTRRDEGTDVPRARIDGPGHARE